MKINTKKIKSNYNNQISIAKANNYDGIVLPIESDCDLYPLTNVEDIDYIYDIANDLGWDLFLLIDFVSGEEKIIDLYEIEAA